MKVILQIQGRQVLFTTEQLSSIVNILRDAEFVDNVHVGKGKGEIGYDKQYTRHIRPFDVVEHLTVQVMPDDLLDTLRLVTQLHDEGK